MAPEAVPRNVANKSHPDSVLVIFTASGVCKVDKRKQSDHRKK